MSGLSSAKHVSKPLALMLALLLSLAACAPASAPGTQRVEVEGSVRAFTSQNGGFGYLLEVRDEGLLALDVGDLKPPMRTRAVVVEVPDTLEVPDDASGRFGALNAYIERTGKALVVVEFIE